MLAVATPAQVGVQRIPVSATKLFQGRGGLRFGSPACCRTTLQCVVANVEVPRHKAGLGVDWGMDAIFANIWPVIKVAISTALPISGKKPPAPSVPLIWGENPVHQ